jgi:hypothetical protein
MKAANGSSFSSPLYGPGVQYEPSARTPTPSNGSVDDEKNVYVEHLDYKTRFPAIEEAKLMRKVDLHLVPVLCVLYLLAFLDRSVPSFIRYFLTK